MKNLQELRVDELSLDELLNIDGGESAWYWVAFYTHEFLIYANEQGKSSHMHSAG